MNRSRGAIILSFVAVLALGPAARAKGLDHFAVYQVKRVPVSFAVKLTDQFAPGAKAAKVTMLTHFSNPTRKVHGATSFGVQDSNRHLTWYAITQGVAEPQRTVRFKNQFGQHSVEIRAPRFLLVPTQKTSHAGSSFPATLDHYKCYEVIRINTAPPLPVVKLGDQFGSQSNVQVGKPRFFCNPVKKERPGHHAVPIQNKVDHLAVYDLPPQAKPLAIKIKDQFGSRPLSVVQKVMLAVPTVKQVAVAH